MFIDTNISLSHTESDDKRGRDAGVRQKLSSQRAV